MNNNKTKRYTAIEKLLKKMRRKMRTTNVLYHAVRNNPRHRDKYYLALIAEVGFENWQYVPTALRMAWESGRTGFDTLYGLIKSFYNNESVITVHIPRRKSTPNRSSCAPKPREMSTATAVLCIAKIAKANPAETFPPP